MTETLCSNGDLSSTPSNRSEYFSVTSSLNILNSTEEVYHSFDEDIEINSGSNLQKYFHKKVEHVKIIKQRNLDIDCDENGYIKSTSDETIPESLIRKDNPEFDMWDKYLQPLQTAASHESVTSLEENCNTSSLFSTENNKDNSLIEVYDNDLSVNEESISCSVNNGTQLNSSQIEGELSDINDIVYESLVSTANTNNIIITEENNSTQTEIDNDLIFESSDSQNQCVISEEERAVCEDSSSGKLLIAEEIEKDTMTIYNMVKQLENSQLEMSLCQSNECDELSAETNLYQRNELKESIKDITLCEKNEQNESNKELSPFHKIGQKDSDKRNESLCHSIIQTVEDQELSEQKTKEYSDDLVEEISKSQKIVSDSGKKSLQIENTNDSPVKRTYLCCSIRRSKRKTENSKSYKYQLPKAKKMFSFLKRFNQDQKPNIEVIVDQKNNQENEVVMIESTSIDFDGIPFIDADVAIDSEAFISLAKQELFSD